MKARYYDEYYDEEPRYRNTCPRPKKSNILPLWGNERSMNLNPLILKSILSSNYFKVNLYGLKTCHEVIDEIYYKVQHLEPWEKSSRKTAGQTGMLGGVRRFGTDGIVSTAYCLLFKLFTLKLTRKQLNRLITHPGSPYIRALGFMYIRYTQPPPDLWDWYDEYLEDSEVLDVKAGGGQNMTIGNILKSFLCKLEWFSTIFPRIPVPIQQKIDENMNARFSSGVTQKTRTKRSYDEVDKLRNPIKDRRREEKGRERHRDRHRLERSSERRHRSERSSERDRKKHYRHRHEERRRHRSRSRSRPRHRHRH